VAANERKVGEEEKGGKRKIEERHGGRSRRSPRQKSRRIPVDSGAKGKGRQRAKAKNLTKTVLLKRRTLRDEVLGWESTGAGKDAEEEGGKERARPSGRVKKKKLVKRESNNKRKRRKAGWPVV